MRDDTVETASPAQPAPVQGTLVFSPASDDPDVARAIAAMGEREAEQRGAVNTKREVAELVLDLAGYTSDRDLHTCRLLEPSFGEGDFLVPVVERLMEAYLRAGGTPADAARDLADAVRAVELHRPTYALGFRAVIKTLERHGVSREDARTLAETWLLWGDFLLVDLDGLFTHVVGNPPYLRQEEIDDALMVAYRAEYSTIYDRADLYVPFFERGLRLLSEDGRLGYICADRWMKNRYGGPLRRLIAEGYELDAFVDMNDAPAFSHDVIAYAAVFVISRRDEAHAERPPTVVASRPKVDAQTLRALSATIQHRRASSELGTRLVPSPLHGGRPWQLGEEAATDLLRSLESRLPTLEEAGCKVGIGVATGNNKVFVRPGDELPIEEDRKLPMALASDVVGGRVEWSGHYVLNPFDDAGRLIDLDAYPRTRSYLEAHATALKKRHVAKKNPDRWYRTIDKVDAALAKTPKLLIPDIKGAASVAYDPGKVLPPEQPVLRHLRRMGRRRASGRASVGGGGVLRDDVLGQNAGGLPAIPGAVPPPDLPSAVG